MAVNAGREARELGAGLLALRNRAGLTSRALAAAIGASAANVSNWERSERLPSEERMLAIFDAVGAAEDERERLLGLRRQAEGPGELVAGVPSIGPQLTRLIESEQAARRITDVAPLLMPGLLQTSQYARAVLGRRDTDTRVALRMGRQEILTRSRNPVELHALIDEDVLVKSIAPPEVMADQLRHLLRMANRPNITLQLVPAIIPGYTPMCAGPFILIEFPTAVPVVHLEHYRASAMLWEDDDVRDYIAAAKEIEEMAMTPARSAEVIENLVNGMESEA